MSKDTNDPFTLHIMGNIDADVFKTLNILQIEAIKQAVAAAKPYKKHPVDLRLTFPLFFVKLYMVLLIGRDRRCATRNKEDARKKKAGAMSVALGIYLTLCAAVPVIFLGLYVVKSLLGIDLMPDKHLSDLF